MHSGICASGKSLLSRKDELDGGENRDYSGGGASIFVESALLLSSNCVTPNLDKQKVLEPVSKIRNYCSESATGSRNALNFIVNPLKYF